MDIVEFKNGIPQTNKKLNGFYEMKKKQDRNGRFLCKYWALMNFSAHNMPEGITYEIDLSNATKDTMHEIVKDVFSVQSVSFGRMSEEDFAKYYSNVLDEMCKLLRTQPDSVINQLVGFM